MRTNTRWRVWIGLTAASFLAGTGCYQLTTDCALFYCGPVGTGGTDGGDSGPLDCTGDPSSTNVIDACGVFAQADAPAGGDGTMATPFTKLGDAVAAAQTAGKRVYACTSAPFKEAVTLSAGVEVYGGFDCTKGWAWVQTARAQLDGPADAVALTIEASAAGAKVESFAITAASPSNMTMGGSSIAVAVDEVTATLEACDVAASDAADGADGTTPSGMATKGADAAPQGSAMGATNACFAAAVGGVPGSTTCDDGPTSGGVGGAGGVQSMDGGDGQAGSNGSPLPSPNPTMAGIGGVGQTDPTDPTKTCQRGQDGVPGTAGNAGPGGSASGDTLSLGGITNTDVTDGQAGTRAQGGGGGGGAMSGTFCPAGAMTLAGVGASGGGGGAGGCGGLGGGGGKAGGSSIAIVSLGTNLTLTAVTLSVGKGGKGGNGVLGQGGGAVGAGAFGGAASGIAGSNPGCNGGNGGKGGDGGPGGGGRGGHAVGIAYAKMPAAGPVVTTFTPGTSGNGGTAGMGAPATSKGASGNAGQCWDFSANVACK